MPRCKSIVATVLCLTLWSLAIGQPAPADTATGRDMVSIEYIAHACFLIVSPAGERVLIDPFASRVWLGYDYPQEIRSDVALITHPHYDHDGGVSVDRPPPWSASTTVWREPGAYHRGDVSILGIAGKHADPYGKEFGQTNTIWVIEVAGLRIAHLGDNGPLPAATALQLGAIDIVMMPADGDYHILKEHEVQPVIEQLAPRLIIPMHYRHADLEPGDGPEDLGELDGWLEGRLGVRTQESHKLAISAATLPARREIFVFEHSPLVTRPATEIDN